MTKLKINIIGPLRIEINGKSALPRLVKCQAILVYLALRENKTASRSWLRTLFWPDRSDSQSSSSMRTCVRHLRKLFEDSPDCIEINHRTISLKREYLSLDIEAINELPNELGILEGFDVKHCEEFEDWLREMRFEISNGTKFTPITRFQDLKDPRIKTKSSEADEHQKPRCLILEIQTSQFDSVAQFKCNVFLDMIAKSVGERLETSILRIESLALMRKAPSEKGLVLSGHVSSSNEVALFHFWISCSETKNQLWTHTFELSNDVSLQSTDTYFVVNLISDVLDSQFQKLGYLQDRLTDVLLNKALRTISSLEKNNLDAAEQILIEVSNLKTCGVPLAWRAYIRSIWMAERTKECDESLVDEGIELARRAMERSPHNSNVLALCAHTMAILNFSHEIAIELSERALDLNESNPLARSTLGVAQSYLGHYQLGRQNTELAQKIGRHSPISPHLSLSAAISATLARDYDAAVRFARISSSNAPTFAAPLRYQSALSFKLGLEEEGYLCVERLGELEAGFEPSWLKESDYPADGLRVSGLVEFLPDRDV